MATVTMTGKEFEELLEVKQKYGELMSLMIGDKFPEIEDSPDATGWAIQNNRKGTIRYPNWLLTGIREAVVRYVSTLSQKQFRNLVKEDYHYYDPHEGEFHYYTRANSIDLLEDYATRARWDAVKIELQEEQENGTEE